MIVKAGRCQPCHFVGCSAGCVSSLGHFLNMHHWLRHKLTYSKRDAAGLILVSSLVIFGSLLDTQLILPMYSDDGILFFIPFLDCITSRDDADLFHVFWWWWAYFSCRISLHRWQKHNRSNLHSVSCFLSFLNQHNFKRGEWPIPSIKIRVLHFSPLFFKCIAGRERHS